MKTIQIWDYTYEFIINTERPMPTLCIYATYKNNAKKYVQWYRYINMEQLIEAKEKFIKIKKDTLERREKYKKERAITRKTEAIKNREEYKVWDLFSYSRWYEQTNTEFFQITEKKGAKVYIKRIWSKHIKTDSWASWYIAPAKDFFLDWYQAENNGWKIIWANWINMNFWTLRPTEEKSEHFYSSRA